MTKKIDTRIQQLLKQIGELEVIFKDDTKSFPTSQSLGDSFNKMVSHLIRPPEGFAEKVLNLFTSNKDVMNEDTYNYLMTQVLQGAIKRFESAKDAILSPGNIEKEVCQKEFEDSTQNLYQCIQVAITAQKNYVGSLQAKGAIDDETIGILNKNKDCIADCVNSFKECIHAVGVQLADLRIADPEKAKYSYLNPRAALTRVADAYCNQYQKEGFWGWVSSFFVKSDRVKEVRFLSELSQRADCDDRVLAQAMSLVQHKIYKTEFFGEGSRLGKILDNLLQGRLKAETENTHSSLVDFVDSNTDIQEMMPDSLKKYLEVHKNDYGSEADIPRTF